MPKYYFYTEIYNMNKIYFFAFLFIYSCTNHPDKKISIENKSQTAEQLYKVAISTYPDSLLLKENLIQLYRDSGEYKAAIELVNNYLKTDSNNARFWEIKAVLHFETNDTIHAISSFENALKIHPDTDDMISLATLFAETKNPMALNIADSLLMRFKKQHEKEALFIKGLYFSATNKKEYAIQYFDQCIAIQYSFMEAYREKAIALYDLKKYNDAILVLTKAVTLKNNYDEGYYYLGKCFEKINNTQAAIEAYQKTLMYNPEFGEAQDAIERMGQ